MNECIRTNNFNDFSVPLDTYITSNLILSTDTVSDTNRSIIWANNGTTITKDYIENNDTTTGITSNETSLLSVDANDFSISLTITPYQNSTEAIILDTRERTTKEEGIVIRQPPESPGSIQVKLGTFTDGVQETTNTFVSVQSAVNSILPNKTYNILVTRNVNRIALYIDGVEVSHTYYSKPISPTKTIHLLNSSTKDKGYIGKLHNFTFINGQSIYNNKIGYKI